MPNPIHRLFILGLLLWPLAPLADGPSGVAQLHAFMDDLKSLRADFQQLVYAQDADNASSASGTLYLQRPDRFRWDYQYPGQQQIIADGISVWYYEPDLEQVSVQFQALALKGTPAKLLTSDEAVEKYFSISEQGERDGLWWVRLTPREEDPRFSDMELGFEDNLLQAMRMQDNFGQTLWFLLEKVEKNIPLDRQLFRFDPPASYDVFQQ